MSSERAIHKRDMVSIRVSSPKNEFYRIMLSLSFRKNTE